MFLSASELFNRIAYIATSKQLKPEVQNKLMHEVLVLTCAAGLKGTKDATGNLFAKVDVLCKQKKMKQLDIFDIQKMRHDSNCSVPLSHEDLLYDLRALALFVSKVLDTDIPDFLTDKIPHSRNPKASIKHVDYRCVRCIVRSVEEETFTAEIAQDANHKLLTINYNEPRFQYLKKILKEGVQVNLIDVTSPPALPCGEGAFAKTTKGHQSASTKKIVVNGEEVTIPIKYFGSIKECNPDLYGLLKEYQLKNRNNPTDAEKIMWEIVRNNNLGIHFRRQHAIDDFIVDFACLSLSIIIEVDGSIHEKKENKINDERRTQILNNKGFVVIRFKNDDIIYNTDAVIEKIQDTIYKRIKTATTERKKVATKGLINASDYESPLYILPCDKSAGEGGGRGSSLLLMSYTNRAVDEICGMLTDNNIDYIRIGNEYTCDKRYCDHLLDYALKDYSKLDEIKEKILSTQVIVGTTATIQNRSYIFDLKHFDVAIVDEASQILEPNIVGLLTKPDKFILIGDYKQLPAVVQQDDNQSVVDDPELQAIGLQDCRNSLFERLIRIEKMNGRNDFIGVLNRQGRMHPEIAQFPNEEFYFDEHLQPVPLPHQEADKLDYTQPSEDDIDDLLKAHRMLFFPSADCRRPDISDKVNTSEAYIVAQLLRRIQRFYGNKFNASKTVGVIVPYRNQIAMIRKEIETLHIPELLDVSIDTVERYQGSQRDVIIYSFTIQNLYQLDFLTSNCFEENGRIIDRKLNVAITRARKQMLITGNESVLKNNQLFKKLIESIPAAPVLYRKPTEVL